MSVSKNRSKNFTMKPSINYHFIYHFIHIIYHLFLVDEELVIYLKLAIIGYVSCYK